VRGKVGGGGRLDVPARRPGDDGGGISAEEFQAKRDERVAVEAADSSDELDAFDPSSLRSDR